MGLFVLGGPGRAPSSSLASALEVPLRSDAVAAYESVPLRAGAPRLRGRAPAAATDPSPRAPPHFAQSAAHASEDKRLVRHELVDLAVNSIESIDIPSKELSLKLKPGVDM